MTAAAASPNATLAAALLGRQNVPGDRIAVRDPDGELSYMSLHAHVTALAGELRAQGIGPGDVVAVALGRGRAAVVAWLAALSAGAAYMPLDLSYPRQRLASMLDVVAPAAVVTDDAGAHELSRGRPFLARADGAPLPRTGARSPGATQVGSEIAYVVFTSGSTGTPKGVSVSARQLERLLAWQRTLPFGDAPVRTAQFSALSFDVSAQEIFSTIAAAGTLEVLSGAARRDPEQLLDELIEREADRLFLPFAALQGLAIAADLAGRAPGLRYVATAGEQLVVTPALRTLFERMPGCLLENHYGPCETHVVTWSALAEDPASWPERPSIGQAMAGCVAEVLDGTLRPVPAGEHGMLYVSEPGLTGGYVGRPDLTAERYVPNVLAGGGERMYSTGDRAWRDAAGDLHFAGRADDQVKIRGHRVEPAEVELALLALPEVRAAAVVVEPGPAGPVLVGHVSVDAPGDALEARLRDALGAVLPGWAVPQRFRQGSEPLPVLPSGKVDRRALATTTVPEPDASQDDATAPLAERLAQLWSAVLAVPVAPGDDFFEIGGHSLAAIELAGRIRAELGLRVKVRQIFECRTASGLADQLEAAAMGGAPAAAE